MRIFVSLSLILLVGCKSSVAIESPPPPVVAPEPAPAPEAEPEEEAEPVVASEPRTLEIQRNVIRLKPGMRILFETNSDKLLADSFEILDEVSSVMSQNARLRVRVEGHTDSAGNDAHNKDLSARRAASVRGYLVEKGVAEDRLTSVGCGEGTPLGDNATEDGKQVNRRVEFVILRRRRVIEECQIYRPRERRKADAPAAPPTP